MAKMHHDFNLDKDTPEAIQQLMEQDPDQAAIGRQGLPAGDRLDNYSDADLFEEESNSVLYGKGESMPRPSERQHSKGPGDTNRTN